MSHFAPEAGALVRADRPAWLSKISGRSVLIVAVVGVCVAIAAAVVVVERFASHRPGTQRPYIRDLNRAPAGAWPLIRQIAQRNDTQCYGRSTGASTTIDKANAANLDYVSVSQVSADRKSVLLSVVCVFASADPLSLTGAGWIEGGARQLSTGYSAGQLELVSSADPRVFKTFRKD